jgi:hypothetical protein
MATPSRATSRARITQIPELAMPNSSRRHIRACECYKPRGPLSKTDFYRRVGDGQIVVKHIGRMAFVPYPSADDLVADLIEKDAAE